MAVSELAQILNDDRSASAIKLVLCVIAAVSASAFPIVAHAMDASYYVVFVTRILIYALAAVSLNLVLGFGGLASFGHAMFLSLGAYCAAVPTVYGVNGAWLHVLLALTLGCSLALLTGLVVLRTRETAFIMTTLAFAQMLYFLLVSLKQFGGDEGLNMQSGSEIAGVQLSDNNVLYFVSLAVLAAVVLFQRRLLHSPFGTIFRGVAANEQRMKALGYPTLLYRLTAYVISGGLCTVCGVLLANLTLFASPSYGSWKASGELMLMVVLGGAGTIGGPIVGAAAFLMIEEVTKGVSPHWPAYLGILIIAISVFSRNGIWTFVRRNRS